ncbi:hypothetical protein [uncultured Bacteroides sp.]|uniref:hypothetical protein n=1 Tax=uncultured Bacteroides sp. TaxID=162156 RepID=UPI00261F0759|nr:hypothetical protein [uncultured Bacteroides sp.]
MNEQLKFSWGHIIAFLTLIFLSYVTFVGVTYMTNGNFAEAGIAMVGIDLVLFLFFIGAQMAKATTHKFKRWIFIERLLIFGSPIIFIFSMVPFAHFWTVHSKNEKIVSEFTQAINASKQMFEDYETYANQRISNYTMMLDGVITNKAVAPDAFRACGFTPGKEYIQKENMIHTLKLQLLSSNYDSLKVEANKWIGASSDGASTWNVFLLGNTREIKSAIHGWNEQLADYAKNKFTNEEFQGNNVDLFGKSNVSLNAVDTGLDNLKAMFVTTDFPPFHAYIIGILLYFALLFPYFLQDRHTKSQYRLLGMERGASSQSTFKVETSTTDYNGKTKTTNKKTNSSEYDSDDDYASFTM